MHWHLLKNSLLLSGWTTLLAVGIGVTVALWCSALRRFGRSTVVFLGITTFALPPFLVTNCWLDLLSPGNLLGASFPFSISSLPGAVLILSSLLWPITAFSTLGAWEAIQQTQLESEPNLRGLSLVRWLLWPAARNAVALAGALTFVLALNNFAIPAILQIKVFPAELWIAFNTQLDATAAMRVGWPLIVAPALLLLFLAKGRDISWPRSERSMTAGLLRERLGPGWFASSGAITLVAMTVSVAVPLGHLVWASKGWSNLQAAVAAGTNAIGCSLLFAAGSATIAVLIGLVPVSRRRFRSKARFSLTPVLWLLLFAPGIFLAIGLIQIFNRPGFFWLHRSVGIVILALTLRYLAVGWHVARTALAGVDNDLADSARMEGASQAQLLKHVYWPQIKSQIAAAWYVIYVLCLWDVETLVLILPPGAETLSLRIFNLLHYGHNSQVNALCIVLVGLALVPLLLWKAGHWCHGLVRRSSLFLLCAWVAVTTLSGCGMGGLSGEAPVQSQFFSRVEVIGSRGTGPGQFNKPRSLALDREDNLYVVDMTGRVQKFSPAGVFLKQWQMPETDLGKPKGMCRDQDGNIVVIEPHYARVSHFSPEGKLVRSWGKHGTNAGQLTLPRAAFVNPTGTVFISEYTLIDRVQAFSPEGQSLLCFGHSGSGPGQFNRPEGLCLDGEGRIYVADSCNHRVQVFDAGGHWLRSHGRAGSGKGELSYPYDIRVDSGGRQYVCEFGNSRIHIYDKHNRPIEILGGPGSQPGRFSNPWSIAFDSKENLYVADTLNHRVQKFVGKNVIVEAATH